MNFGFPRMEMTPRSYNGIFTNKNGAEKLVRRQIGADGWRTSLANSSYVDDS
jgi:hypothetical protein